MEIFDPGNRQNTGTYSADNYSNIHDLLGNCYEWTTESLRRDSSPGVRRGGGYYSNLVEAAYRNGSTTSGTTDGISFRLQLYVK